MGRVCRFTSLLNAIVLIYTVYAVRLFSRFNKRNSLCTVRFMFDVDFTNLESVGSGCLSSGRSLCKLLWSWKEIVR